MLLAFLSVLSLWQSQSAHSNTLIDRILCILSLECAAKRLFCCFNCVHFVPCISALQPTRLLWPPGVAGLALHAACFFSPLLFFSLSLLLVSLSIQCIRVTNRHSLVHSHLLRRLRPPMCLSLPPLPHSLSAPFSLISPSLSISHSLFSPFSLCSPCVPCTVGTPYCPSSPS